MECCWAGCLYALRLLWTAIRPQVVLTSQLTKLLHCDTTVQEVRFNPFYLTLQVKGFALKDRNGADPFVSFEELALDLEAASNMGAWFHRPRHRAQDATSLSRS